MSEEWKRSDFQRRRVEVKDSALADARRIEIAIIVDGKQLVRVGAREPGLVACYSTQDDSLVIDIVEAAHGQYRDVIDLPGARGGEPIDEWHAVLMGIES
jgi:hypothetical protein